MLRAIYLLWVVLCLAGCSEWISSNKTISVSKGDTLYSLSKTHSVPLRDLIDINNLKPPYTLKVGQKLLIPADNYYIVKKGDTIYAISKKYDMSVTELARANNMLPPYKIMIGQRLALYGAGASAAPSPSSSYSAKPKVTYAQANKKTYKPAAKTTKSSYVSSNRKTKFIWPVEGQVVSKFGTIGKGRSNDGINIKAPRGTAVKAADTGVVAYVGNELEGFGNLILIRHDDRWITAYAHNDKFFVKKGQKVSRGQKIASVGSTGGVNSPQLHFETRAGKKAVNPISYLP